MVSLMVGCGDGDHATTSDTTQKTGSTSPAPRANTRRGVFPDARTTDYDAVAGEYAAGRRPELRDPIALATSYARDLFSQRTGQPAEVSVVDSPNLDVPGLTELDFKISIANRPELMGAISLERYGGASGFWYVTSVLSKVFTPLDVELDGSKFTGKLVSSVAGRAQVRVRGIQSKSLARDDAQDVGIHGSLSLDAAIDDPFGALVDVSMQAPDGAVYLALLTF